MRLVLTPSSPKVRRPRRSARRPTRPAASSQPLSPAAEATRNRLLAAAELEFGRFGFEGARLDRIAEAVGVKTPLVHHYFDGKEALYRAVVERALGSLASEVGALVAAGAGPSDVDRDQLTRMGEALAQLTQQFYRRHESLFAIVRSAIRSGDKVSRTLLLEHVRPALNLVLEQCRHLQKAGVIRADLDLRQLLASVISMSAYPIIEDLIAEALFRDARQDDRFVERRARAIVDLALYGMLPRR